MAIVVVDKEIELIESLPPAVAALAWDVINDHVTENTIALARTVSQELYEQYDLVRMLAAGNSRYPDLLARNGKVLIDLMLEEK